MGGGISRPPFSTPGRLGAGSDKFPERTILIEINWGKPLTFVLPEGDVKTFTTLETAAYWLERRWPVDDVQRRHAAQVLDAAAHCMTPIGSARAAFANAAQSAGFRPC